MTPTSFGPPRSALRARSLTLLAGTLLLGAALLACKKGEGKKKSNGPPSFEEQIAARKSADTKLPWKDGDFDNTKLSYEDTGVAPCNAILNACFACRKRVGSNESNRYMEAAMTEQCRRYREPYKKMASDKTKMEATCNAIMKEMKAAPDCVRASWDLSKKLK